jgi:hypothetical protein
MGLHRQGLPYPPVSGSHKRIVAFPTSQTAPKLETSLERNDELILRGKK